LSNRTATPVVISYSLVNSFFETVILDDPTMTSIELQRVSAPAGDGHVAIVHSHDHTISLYADYRLGLDRAWFDSDPAYINLARADFHQSEIDVEQWDIRDGGVDVAASFQLADGREIVFEARQESGPDKGIRQFIPTPASGALHVLRFLDADGFGLLRRGDCHIDLSADGQKLQLADFKIPVGGRQRLDGVFSSSAVIAGLNPPGDHKLEPLEDHLQDPIRWKTNPFIPQPTGLKSTTTTRISFSSYNGPTPLTGVTTADLTFKERGDHTMVALDNVVQDWRPSRRQPSLWVLSQLRRQKRRGVRWAWRGEISNECNLLTNSRWSA